MIIFMGVAGSGKSTQAGMLAQELGCQRLGVGDLLRMNMDGEQAKKMLAGEMISDDILLPILGQEIKKLKQQQFILDGSPRSMEQAKWWVERAKNGEVDITAVIHLKTSEPTAKKRLLARHRPDDREDAIRERFNEYNSTIQPMLSYLREEGIKVYDIDGERAPGVVDKEIKKVLEINR
jgi:adenylate kinase family enzyme